MSIMLQIVQKLQNYRTVFNHKTLIMPKYTMYKKNSNKPLILRYAQDSVFRFKYLKQLYYNVFKNVKMIIHDIMSQNNNNHQFSTEGFSLFYNYNSENVYISYLNNHRVLHLNCIVEEKRGREVFIPLYIISIIVILHFWFRILAKEASGRTLITHKKNVSSTFF